MVPETASGSPAPGTSDAPAGASVPSVPSRSSSATGADGVPASASRSWISRFNAAAENRMVAPLSRSPLPDSSPVTGEDGGVGASLGSCSSRGRGSNPLPTGRPGTATGSPTGGAGGVKGALGAGTGEDPAAGGEAGTGGVGEEGPEEEPEEGEGSGEDDAAGAEGTPGPELPEAFCVYQAGGA